MFNNFEASKLILSDLIHIRSDLILCVIRLTLLKLKKRKRITLDHSQTHTFCKLCFCIILWVILKLWGNVCIFSLCVKNTLILCKYTAKQNQDVCESQSLLRMQRGHKSEIHLLKVRWQSDLGKLGWSIYLREVSTTNRFLQDFTAHSCGHCSRKGLIYSISFFFKSFFKVLLCCW